MVQGAPVTTLDVDIVHRQDSENIARLYAFLKSVAAFYRRPNDKVIEPKREDLSEMAYTFLTTLLGPLDFLVEVIRCVLLNLRR